MRILEEFARLDFDRHQRCGVPEIIFAERKDVHQLVEIVRAMAERRGRAIISRITPEQRVNLERELGNSLSFVSYDVGRVLVAAKEGYTPPAGGGALGLLAAGTADLPVAEEARAIATEMGCEVLHYYDVGVAGLHRLAEPLTALIEHPVSVMIVVAGMEGALPSVVRGLVPVPVIGVPTSVGYGYGRPGEAALLSMLHSCTPGLTVVNVDNGVGAGATAALIANQVAAAKRAGAESRGLS